MVWPAHTPYLNPIENVWRLLKYRVGKRCPRTDAEVRQFVEEEWEKLAVEDFEKYIKTCLRGAVPESVGFLGGERRRFNVAMSRAKAGRIVIATKEFAKRKGMEESVWQALIDQHMQRRWVINDSIVGQLPDEPTIKSHLQQRLLEVQKSLSVPGRTAPVAGPSSGRPTAKEAHRRNTRKLERDCFMEATGADAATADSYLAEWEHYHEAINAFFQTHGDGEEAEDVETAEDAGAVKAMQRLLLTK